MNEDGPCVASGVQCLQKYKEAGEGKRQGGKRVILLQQVEALLCIQIRFSIRMEVRCIGGEVTECIIVERL